MKTIKVLRATPFVISRDELVGWLTLIYPAPLGPFCSVDEPAPFKLEPSSYDDKAWKIAYELMDGKTPPAEYAEWALDLLLDAARAGRLDSEVNSVLVLRILAWRMRRLAQLRFEDAQEVHHA